MEERLNEEDLNCVKTMFFYVVRITFYVVIITFDKSWLKSCYFMLL